VVPTALIVSSSLWLSIYFPASSLLTSAGPSPTHAADSKQDTRRRSIIDFLWLHSQKEDSYGSSDSTAQFGTRDILTPQLCIGPFPAYAPWCRAFISEHVPLSLTILTKVIVNTVLRHCTASRATRAALCLLTCVCSCAVVAATQAMCTRRLHWYSW
jgi:hypothetical protein